MMLKIINTVKRGVAKLSWNGVRSSKIGFLQQKRQVRSPILPLDPSRRETLSRTGVRGDRATNLVGESEGLPTCPRVATAGTGANQPQGAGQRGMDSLFRRGPSPRMICEKGESRLLASLTEPHSQGLKHQPELRQTRVARSIVNQNITFEQLFMSLLDWEFAGNFIRPALQETCRCNQTNDGFKQGLDQNHNSEKCTSSSTRLRRPLFPALHSHS